MPPLALDYSRPAAPAVVLRLQRSALRALADAGATGGECSLTLTPGGGVSVMVERCVLMCV